MFLKVYKSRVWIMLFMLLPFIGNAQIPGLPAGWGFTLNPTSATYAIPTTVAYNGVGALQAGDWVGAFFEDAGVLKCAGAIQWTGAGNVALVAFGNDGLNPVKNGFADGELVKWKFYRTGTSEEVCVKAYNSLGAEFNWANGVIDAVASFGACVAPPVCQTINLLTGTRLISTFIQPNDQNFRNIMTDVLDNLSIAKNSAGATLRKVGPNWVNSIGNWIVTEGYSVRMNAPDVLQICGTKVPFNTPIPVSATKLVAYLHDSPMNALTAVNNILPNLSIVKNSTGATLRKIGPNWVNSIGNFIPGEGYSVRMNAADVLIYPALDNKNSVGLSTSKESRDGHFVWPGGDATDNTWSLYIDLAMFNGVSLQPGDEIAILDGNKIVGVKTLTTVPTPGTFSEELAAFKTLGDGNPGYVPGNPMTLKCWSVAANMESEEFSVVFNDPGGAYMSSLFPVANNEYSVVAITFTTVLEECPELVSAVAGDESIVLTWTGLGEGVETLDKEVNRLGHFVWPGGDATDNTWSLYIDLAMFNGISLQPGDEIAILDGAKIVGVKTLTTIPTPGTFSEELAAFKTLGDGNPGYVPGNPMTLKAWSVAANMESEEFSVAFNDPGGAYMSSLFPVNNNEYSVVAITFTTVQPYVPTFNIYMNGELYVSAFEGTSITVDGLTNGEEYCFTVTQNLEDLTESCLSNELCAIPVAECLDASISNFPASIDDVCNNGAGYNINFVNVVTENGSPIWSVNPVNAGYFDQYIFWSYPDYVGLVTISLLVVAEEPCEDAFASVSFDVFAPPVIECPAYEPLCEGGDFVEFTEPGVFHFDGEVITGWNPSAPGMFMIHYIYTDPETGCSNDCMFEIEVIALPVAECPENVQICEDHEPFMWGGYYIDPAALGAGTWPFVVEVTNACGTDECTFYVTVLPLPEPPVCPENVEVCIDAEPFEIGGIMFDPLAQGVGTHEFTLFSSNECGYLECTFTVTVFGLPEVTCPGSFSVFLSQLPITLEGAEPMGGEYSGIGVLGNDFLVFELGEYLITYTYTDIETGCTNLCTFVINVEADPTPELVFANLQWPPTGQICLDNFQPVTVYGQVVIENGVFNEETGYEGLEVSIGYGAPGSNPADFTTWIPASYFGISGFTGRPEYVAQIGGGLVEGTYDYATRFLFNDVYYYGGFDGGFWDGVNNVSGELTVLEFCEIPPCSIEWANVQWPLSGDILVGDDFDVYAQVYSANYPAQTIPGLSVWIGYSTENVHPSLFGAMIPATFNSFAGNNSEFVANIGEWILEPGTYYYASIFQCENGEYVYGGIGGFWDNNSGVLVVNEACSDAEISNFPENGWFCEGTTMIDFSDVVVLNAIEEIWTIIPAEAGFFENDMFYIAEDYIGEIIIVLDAIAEAPCLNAFAQVTFDILPLPVVDCPEDQVLCYNDDPFVYGDFVFDPSMYEPGVYDFTFEASNQCGTVECSFMITVIGAPVVECPEDQVLCYNDEPFVYGDFTFDPSMYDPGVYPFTFTESNECGTVECSFMITVIGAPVAVCPPNIQVCSNDEPFEYGGYLINPAELGAGVNEFSITVSNDCGEDVCYFYVTVLPAPSITEQPQDAAALYGMDAEFTVVAENADGYQWYGPDGLIDGATDATLTLMGVTLVDAGDYYVVVTNECAPGGLMSEVATLTVNPWTQVIDLNGAVNGMSTYLELFVDDIATIVAPIMNDLQYVEFYQPNQVYVPGAMSFPWNEEKGAKVGLSGGYPTSLTVTGYPTLGTVVSLPQGWSIMPVWSQGVVLASDVFGPLGNQLIAAFSIDYSGVYWPQYGVYSLQYLVPGSAYLVALASPGTVDFDVPLVKATTPGYVSMPANVTSWKTVQMTGVQHNIAITADALAQLKVGDVIGAFNQNGSIAGMVEITNLNDNTVIRVYGNEFTSKSINGFVEGDVLTFKAYRNGEVIDLTATFDANMPNTDVFSESGLSSIVSLKAGVTAINDLSSELNVNLFPNPAKDFVNIETNFEIRNVKVVNYVGQLVFDQNVDQIGYQINTSDFGPGMYFVQIQTLDGVVITKRLTVN